MEAGLKQVRRSYSRMGLAYLVFFLAAGASRYAAAVLLEPVRGAAGESIYRMLCMLAMYPVAFPLCWLVVRTVPKRGPSWQFNVGGGRFAAIFVICLGMMMAGNLIGQLLMFLAALLTGWSVTNGVEELILNMEPWCIFVVTVAVAPVLEELLFRKFLLDRVACYGQLTAVLMSGLLFALAHGNFYQFFYAFALGAVFAYVYLRTGRIRYPAALHILVNFSGSILPVLMLHFMEANVTAGSLLVLGWYLVLGACVIGAAVLLILGRKQIWFYRMPARVPAGKWVAAVCVNAGMILFFVYSLLRFASA